MGIEGHTCSGVRIACHSFSDLVLLASDIFRVIAKLDEVGADESMGREIDWSDERAASVNISDENVSVMCTMYSAKSRLLLSVPRERERTLHAMQTLQSDKSLKRV